MTSRTVSTTIDGTIALNASDDLTVTGSGTIIAGTTAYAVVDSGAIGTLTNDGEIRGSGGISAAGSISSLSNNGHITATQQFGILASSIGTLTNAGTIGGAIFAILDQGTLTSLNNESGGRISAARTTVYVAGGIGTVTNAGIIDSGSCAFEAATLTSLDNGSGGIISGRTAINVSGSIGTLTNEGSITASASGYSVTAGSIGTLTNDGIISGGESVIYDAGNLGSLDNAAGGTITGNGNGNAINVRGSIGTLTNEGLISGSIGIIAAGTASIENAGTISGGLAILMAGSGSTLTIDPTSVIDGSVVDTVGDGTLVLGGSGANTVTGIGTQYTGFATISFDNADATAEGNATGLADGETLTGFGNGDSIKLDHFAAVSETYVSGTGLILTDANSNTETLDITGSYDAADFTIASDGTDTTITDPTITITTRVTTQVNFGTAENLVVTTSGRIITSSSTAVVAGHTIGAISNNGEISGSSHGIVVNGAIGILTNEGSISGRFGAVSATQGINDLSNSGSISSVSGSAVASSGTIGTLTNEGSIIGADVFGAAGVYAATGINYLDNSGTIEGQTAVETNGGIGTVSNAGTIDGSTALAASALTSLDNAAGGVIEGRTAIDVSGSIGTLTNEGSISAAAAGFSVQAGSIGTLTNDGTIGGGVSVINDTGNLGRLDNAAGGAITGTSNGIDVGGSIGTLTNEGLIQISGFAIIADGIASIENAGTITGAAAIHDSGTLTSLANDVDGTITANGTAIYAGTGIGTVTNAGTIKGGGNAFNAPTLTSLDNAAGGVIDGRTAINISGSIGTLTNEGNISGGTTGYAVEAGSIGTLTNDGTISGGSIGIDDSGNLTSLDNQSGGVINGNTAVLVSGNIGTLTNEGSITAASDAISGAFGIDYLSNSGTISSTHGDGIDVLLFGINTLINSGVIDGGQYGVSSKGAGAITNSGTIGGLDGVQVSGNLTSLDNTAGATISGSGTAIDVTGSIGALTNDGTISGGIRVSGNLTSLDNAQGGSITAAKTAIYASTGIAAVTNSGLIDGGQYGIVAPTLTSLNNTTSGTIQGRTAIDVSGSIGTLTNEGLISTGGVGINAGGSATIANSGTIFGGNDAILFQGAGSTLILDPTSVINGSVVDTVGDGTLVLAGTTANTVTGIGTQYTGFDTISFDNANATAEGNTAGLANGETITGLAIGDSVVLDNFAAVSETYVSGTGLILTDTNSNTETLDITGSYTAQDFLLSNDGTNTTVTDTEPLCFLPGTLILTPDGEVPVQDLRAGDRVVTLDGRARPIRWIGHGSLLAPAGRRGPATPVLIRRGALAEDVPHRDLYVTKGHAIYLNGVLIPAEFLVNHRSILWDDRGQEVTFYHIELDGHEVLRANGAPAESYRDEGNRWMFRNANPAWDQPGVAPFAPVLTGGERVDAAWRRLLERSGVGLNLPTTDEPDLHLLVDGARMEGRRLAHDAYSFTLPSGARRIAIASRASAPDLLGVFRDPRLLGVAVSRIVLWQDGEPHIVDADDDALTDGFHGYEPAEGCRWTNGHAVLPGDLTCSGIGPQILQLYIQHTARYAAPEVGEPLRLRA